MLPEAHISHQLPGRTRLRIPSRRGDESYFAQINQQLIAIGSGHITHVSSNSLLGTVLVVHRNSLSKLKLAAAQHGLFQLNEQALPAPLLSERIAANVVAINTAANRIISPSLDVQGLVLVSLFGLAAVQFARGHVLPPTLTLLWYSFSMPLVAHYLKQPPPLASLSASNAATST